MFRCRLPVDAPAQPHHSPAPPSRFASHPGARAQGRERPPRLAASGSEAALDLLLTCPPTLRYGAVTELTRSQWR